MRFRIVKWVSHALLLGLCALSISASADADDSGPKARIEVIVAELSDHEGKIDEAASRLHRELKDQFRYSSITVVDKVRFDLGIDDVGRRKLPNGRTLMVRPILLEKKSGLFSVDISGLVQTDLRLDDDQLVIIGVEKVRDGRLVIALEVKLR